MISAILVLALLATEAGAQENESEPLNKQTSANQTHTPDQAADVLVMPKGMPLCLLVTETVSSATAKAGDHVTFRVDNDLSVQGLTVVSPGTKIDATVRKVQRPRNWIRDAALGFSLGSLTLIMGTEGKRAAFADFALLQRSGNQCKVLRVSQVLFPPQIVDTTDCSDVSKSGQAGQIALRPAQILGDKYVTAAASPQGRHTLAIGSVTTPARLTPIANLDASYSRYDPVWRDATHLVYVRRSQK